MAMEIDSPNISSVRMSGLDPLAKTAQFSEVNDEDMDDIRFRALRPPQSHDYAPGTYTCTQFFRSIGEDGFKCEPLKMQWEYEQRREAQKVLPFLYLGPTSAARDIEFLKREGITMVFAVRSKFQSHALLVNADKAAAAAGIQSDHMAVRDFYEFMTMIPEAVRRINNHVCRCPAHANSTTPTKKKVLVFCETGNERSACLMTAYLMVMLNLPMYSALNSVQARRLCINVDMPVREVLKSFDALLNAQRDVFRLSRMPPAAGLYATNGTKRSRASFGGGIEMQDRNDAIMRRDEDDHQMKRQNMGKHAESI